jgi:hypothetical protein
VKKNSSKIKRFERRYSLKKLSMFLVFALAIALLPSIAQSAGEIKGYMFAEYYSVLSHHTGSIDDGGIEGRHGFWFRRIYFTYNNKLTDNIKMRLRLEFNSPGDFKSGSKMTPVVKDAYLSAKIGGQDLMAGIISTPTWNNIEKIWGYRSIEKTPLDLMKMGSSRDFGVGLKGNLTNGKTVSYVLMFGNGASNKGETDQGKKFYGLVGFEPANGFYLEAYADYETQRDDKRYYLYQGFASYEGDWGRFGLQYAKRHFKQEILAGDDKENDWSVLSAFAVVKASDKVDVIARYDKMLDDPVTSTISYIPFSKQATSNLIIGAVSWKAAKNVWLIPNLKYVFYDDPDEGEKPSEDMYANLTLWFKF